MCKRVAIAAAVALFASLVCYAAAPKAKPPAAVEQDIAVFFSPDGGALAAIVEQINGAKKTIDMQAYMLSTKEIAGPLAKAHERGVKVRALMDAENAAGSYSSATYLSNAGVPVWVDAEHKESHNKIILIDGNIIITGSFNFTLAAEEKNAENLLVMQKKPKLYAAYLANFESHLKHATPYAKP